MMRSAVSLALLMATTCHGYEAILGAINESGEQTLVTKYDLPSIDDCTQCVVLQEPFVLGKGEAPIGVYTEGIEDPIIVGLNLFEDDSCGGKEYFSAFYLEGDQTVMLKQDEMPPSGAFQSFAQCTSSAE